MSDDSPNLSRRRALQCLAYGGGTLFVLSSGVIAPIDLAAAAQVPPSADLGTPLFVQISDTHIGFHKEANPDVTATLSKAIADVNALPVPPPMILHTGDVTHLSKPEQFDTAEQLLAGVRATELHVVPGEHDVADPTVSEFFARFGKPSRNKGYYAFDHGGVHFVALINVLQAKDGGAGYLGDEQLAWAVADLQARSSSTPIVVFAHMPLWNVYEPWGWRTSDSARLTEALRRFGSVTVLNGHIHQIAQKIEGNITFHTARSTAFPQPKPGEGPGPGPLKVPTERLSQVLGITRVSLRAHPRSLALTDTTLAEVST